LVCHSLKTDDLASSIAAQHPRTLGGDVAEGVSRQPYGFVAENSFEACRSTVLTTRWAQTLNENPYREFESLSLRHLSRSRMFSGRVCRAIKPNSGTDFSFELRTPSRQGELVILRKAHLSPKLWTPRIRYGARNSNVSKGL